MARCLVFILLVFFSDTLISTSFAEGHISKRILELDENFQNQILRRKNKDDRARSTSQSKSRRQRLPLLDPSKIDLVFVIDQRSKSGPRNLNLIKRFVSEVTEYLPVFPAKTRVACVSLAARTKLEFSFKKHINKECTIKAIQNIRYASGQPSFGRAIDFIRESLLFNAQAGARNKAQKIIVVFTDDEARNIRRIFTRQLGRSGVSVIVVGVRRPSRTSDAPLRRTGEPQRVFYLGDRSTLKQLVELLGRDSSRKCRTGQIVHDECRRRCRCVNGKLVQCCRVRKPFTEMSVAERERYVAVIKTASTHPAFKENYERLLTIHKTIFRTGIHQSVFFLPWHRWFILQYENLLREVDCTVTVPYWESAEEANNALASDVWNTGSHGFGGNGTGDSNCVQDGPFRAGEWSVIASAGGGCLRRNFNGRFPDCLTVKEAMLKFASASRFDEFEYFLHREFHDAVHCVIGGQMCTDNSATSPEFFLHHGFIDNLWYDWQRQSNEHTFNEHFVSQTERMPSTGHFSKDLLDLRDQPGCVCAEYHDPSDGIYTTINAFSIAQVRDIPRVPLPPYPESAKKLFQLSDRDMSRLEQIRKELKPVHILREDSLKGQDRVLGFRKKDLATERDKGSSLARFRRSSSSVNREVKDGSITGLDENNA